MNKYFVLGAIVLLLVSGYFAFFDNHEVKITPRDTGLYQGPIQEGYNETLFRETGLYKKIGDSNK